MRKLYHQFSEDEREVIEALESSLFALAMARLNREQAIALKSIFMVPLGVLSSRNNLKGGKDGRRRGDEYRRERLSRCKMVIDNGK